MPTQSVAAIAAELRRRTALVENSAAPAAVRRNFAIYGSPCEPDCPICGGYGWLRSDAPVSDPLFGKVVPCPNAKLQVDRSRCGLDEAEQAASWDSIVDVNDALAAVSKVRQVLTSGRGWAYLWGKPGLAKTALLKIGVAEALRLGREAAYVNAADLLSDVRDGFDSKDSSSNANRRLAYWAELPVLALDELDKISDSPWVREVRFALLDRRYEQAVRGLSVTLLASQVPPERLPEELASRVKDGRFKMIHLSGEDYRREMWWEKI